MTNALGLIKNEVGTWECFQRHQLLLLGQRRTTTWKYRKASSWCRADQVQSVTLSSVPPGINPGAGQEHPSGEHLCLPLVPLYITETPTCVLFTEL